MPRLKSRMRQLPGGMYFIQAETNFRSRPWQSFNVIVDTLIAHREQNPAMTAKWKRPTNRVEVENEVDAYMAQVCAQMGWHDFIINDAAPPQPVMNPNAAADLSKLAEAGAKVRNIWAGLRNVGEWIDSNAPTVTQEVADSRGNICLSCPKNGKGDFTAWFIAPVAGAIKRQVEKINARNLKTANDEKLGVCEACTCALKVKVWEPIDFIKKHTSDETLDKLRTAPACWVVVEIANA